MIALLIAVAGFAVIGGLFIAVMCWPHRPTTYTADRAAAGPLLDRTEGLI